MIVAQAAGGPTDVVTRIYATKLSELLGRQVVVDNRVGAGGTIAGELVAHAPADGYTLCVMANGTAAIAEVLPGYEATSWYAVLTRAGTPRAVIDRLNAASAKAVMSPDVHPKLVAVSVDPETLTPEQLGAKIRKDYEHWGKVVKAAGVKVQ